MITLPAYPPRRAVLVSFCLVMSCAGGLLIGIASLVLLSLQGFLAGTVLASAIALLGFLRPQAVSIPYRAWNRLAREFARVARPWLIAICYYIVFVAVGRTESSFRLARPALHESL